MKWLGQINNMNNEGLGCIYTRKWNERKLISIYTSNKQTPEEEEKIKRGGKKNF